MILFKKAVRAMFSNKRAYIACILLIAIGITMYVSIGVTINRMEISKNNYYSDYKLADGFAKVKNIPASAEESLRRIEGILDVSLRLVHEARVSMPGNEKIITMRLVSVPDNREASYINNVFYKGSDFYLDNDVWVDEDFLTSHELSIGDNITLLIDGKENNLNICGTANSPEYVFIIRNALEMLPDPETFSIGFMPVSSMGRLLNRNGIYNDVTFTLKEGYKFDDVKPDIEDELRKYGLIELYPQKDQISVSMLQAELDGMSSMADSIPLVFMFMAIIILYLMLKRVIEQDRMQIGTMKAFGYSSGKILEHYLFYGIITGFLGSVFGVILGYFVANAIGNLYSEFFKLPYQADSPMISFIINGFLVGILGGALGAFMGAKNIINLLPADAMRPVAPKAVLKDILKYIPFLNKILTSSGYMAIRSMLRNKLRSSFVIIGIMFSFGILAFMGSYNDMIDVMMMDQYTKIQLYDMKINYNTRVAKDIGVENIMKLEGMEQAEGLLEIPVELTYKNIKKTTFITGIEENSALYKIYDNKFNYSLSPSKNGITINADMAKSLDVDIGDILTVSSAYLKEDISLVVEKTVNMNLGQAVYMEINALSRAFYMSDNITAVIFKTNDPIYIKEYAKGASNILFLEDVQMTSKGYKEYLEPFIGLIYFMEIMAVIVAVAIIYNIATISLSERKREYATLRVLGMHSSEVSQIMSFEYWILCFLGILVGFPFTYLMKLGIASSFEMEMFSFPTNTPASAYLIATIGCVVAVFLSNRTTAKIIKNFDMVETLKERD